MSFGEMFLSGLSAVFSGGHFLMVLLAIVLGSGGAKVRIGRSHRRWGSRGAWEETYIKTCLRHM